LAIVSRLGWPEPNSDDTFDRSDESSDDTSDSGSLMMGADAALDVPDEEDADGAAPKNAAADVEPDDEDDDAVGCEADDEAGNWPSWSCTRFLAWSIAAAQLDCARGLAADTDADAVAVEARSVLAARVWLRGTLESTERASVGGMIQVASSYGGDERSVDPSSEVVCVCRSDGVVVGCGQG
jgi:hypothetical protein